MRDTQRQRLYDAERTLPRGRTYPTVSECQRRVDAILATATARKIGGWQRRVRVHDGRGHRRAVSYGGTIALPKWARCEVVILHELAHELCPVGEKHGPRFVRAFHDLLRRFMGAEVAEQFLVECAARGVKVAGKRLPRARVTDEHREAVAAERSRRAEDRKLGGFEAALEMASVAAANCGKRITVVLESGVGYMYGQLPDDAPIDVAWGRRSCKAVVAPNGAVSLRS